MRDAELARRVLAESDYILSRYDCEQMHTTFGSFGTEQTRHAAPEGLLVDLVQGWRYLIDRDRRVLAWIMEYQKPHFEWPPYPIPGTPSAGQLVDLSFT